MFRGVDMPGLNKDQGEQYDGEKKSHFVSFDCLVISPPPSLFED